MVWRILKKLGIKPPYDPTIPLQGIYPEETKIEKDICTPVFIAALFTIARTWKQPRYPSTDEWKKKKWYIYTMEYLLLSHKKRNEIGSFVVITSFLYSLTLPPLSTNSLQAPKTCINFKISVFKALPLHLIAT